MCDSLCLECDELDLNALETMQDQVVSKEIRLVMPTLEDDDRADFNHNGDFLSSRLHPAGVFLSRMTALNVESITLEVTLHPNEGLYQDIQDHQIWDRLVPHLSRSRFPQLSRLTVEVRTETTVDMGVEFRRSMQSLLVKCLAGAQDPVEVEFNWLN